MSTLRAGTLSNVAGTGSPVITGGELSRARFNLNGTGTIAARDSFNIASFTDNGAGDYTANVAVASPNALYSYEGNLAGTSNVLFFVGGDVSTARTVSLFRMFALNNTFTPTDCSTVDCAVFGDIP